MLYVKNFIMILHTHRNYAKDAIGFIFPYIHLLLQSRLKNVDGKSIVDEQRLNEIIISSLMQECEMLIKNKVEITAGTMVKIKLSYSQAAAMYKTLLQLPENKGNHYLQMIKKDWLDQLKEEVFGP